MHGYHTGWSCRACGDSSGMRAPADPSWTDETAEAALREHLKTCGPFHSPTYDELRAQLAERDAEIERLRHELPGKALTGETRRKHDEEMMAMLAKLVEIETVPIKSERDAARAECERLRVEAQADLETMATFSRAETESREGWSRAAKERDHFENELIVTRIARDAALKRAEAAEDKLRIVEEQNDALGDANVAHVRNAQLVEALRKYGQHGVRCGWHTITALSTVDGASRKPCTCGLDAALNAQGGSDE
jgi:hypothetical protein